jgi:formylglycine-generating enzyme required for sulfatase activity
VSFEQLAADPSRQTKREINRAYDLAQRRRANVLIAMWQLGDNDAALRALRYDADPALRAWLIELLAPLDVSVDTLWALANSTDDDGTRQALLLAIGQADFAGMGQSDRQTLAAAVLQIYRTSPDAGVHSACRWLLINRLGAADNVRIADSSLKSGVNPSRKWYVGPNGHLFTVFFGARHFAMGSPVQELSREEDEALHEESIPHGFAISTEEVTIAQCRKLRGRFFNTRYSPTEDCPANNISWFDAAAYCRALSELEGLSEDQMCYPSIDQIRAGMKLPENWQERTGYRLPTEAEWEYACRSDVAASRFCGPGDELLSRYAWYLNDSDNRAWPVGLLKPNNFGLFDVLGNVGERCQDSMVSYTSDAKHAAAGESTQEQLAVNIDSMRAIRGGNFDHGEENLRSARRNANSAGDEWAIVGFRIARTLVPQQ